MFFEDQTLEDAKQEKPKSKVVRNHDSDSSPMVHGNSVEDAVDENVEDDTNENHVSYSNSDQREDPNESGSVESEVQEEPQLRRSITERRPSTRYGPDEYITLTDEGGPQSYEEAMTDCHKSETAKAMHEEMQSLHENYTYDLVELPKGRRALKNKWVYRLKTEENNSKPRYKARLVVKRSSQRKGIDFEEIFSLVVKVSSIRVVLGLATSLDLEMEQLDVKTAFLHGDLEEELYMEQPEGFEVVGKENLVCRLKKGLYGFKQAPRQWYKRFDSFMVEHNFKKTLTDHCVFVKKYASGDFIILLLYVDDMLIIGYDPKSIIALNKALSKSFAIKDLRSAKQILGIKITQG